MRITETAHPMKIDVRHVHDTEKHFTGTLDPARDIGLEPEVSFTPSGPMAYDMAVQVLGKELLVRGSVELPVEYDCSRCGEKVSTSLKIPAFCRAYPILEDSEIIDVGPDIREDILLAAPAYPLCKQECKGLCPRCGTKLNTGVCSCREPEAESPWGALDNLKI